MAASTAPTVRSAASSVAADTSSSATSSSRREDSRRSSARSFFARRASRRTESSNAADRRYRARAASTVARNPAPVTASSSPSRSRSSSRRSHDARASASDALGLARGSATSMNRTSSSNRVGVSSPGRIDAGIEPSCNARHAESTSRVGGVPTRSARSVTARDHTSLLAPCAPTPRKHSGAPKNFVPANPRSAFSFPAPRATRRSEIDERDARRRVDDPRAFQHDVLGLDVAVHHPDGVEKMYGAEKLRGDGFPIPRGHRAAARHALDEIAAEVRVRHDVHHANAAGGFLLVRRVDHGETRVPTGHGEHGVHLPTRAVERRPSAVRRRGFHRERATRKEEASAEAFTERRTPLRALAEEALAEGPSLRSARFPTIRRRTLPYCPRPRTAPGWARRGEIRRRRRRRRRRTRRRRRNRNRTKRENIRIRRRLRIPPPPRLPPLFGRLSRRRRRRRSRWKLTPRPLAVASASPARVLASVRLKAVPSPPRKTTEVVRSSPRRRRFDRHRRRCWCGRRVRRLPSSGRVRGVGDDNRDVVVSLVVERHRINASAASSGVYASAVIFATSASIIAFQSPSGATTTRAPRGGTRCRVTSRTQTTAGDRNRR